MILEKQCWYRLLLHTSVDICLDEVGQTGILFNYTKISATKFDVKHGVRTKWPHCVLICTLTIVVERLVLLGTVRHSIGKCRARMQFEGLQPKQ